MLGSIVVLGLHRVIFLGCFPIVLIPTLSFVRLRCFSVCCREVFALLLAFSAFHVAQLQGVVVTILVVLHSYLFVVEEVVVKRKYMVRDID